MATYKINITEIINQPVQIKIGKWDVEITARVEVNGFSITANNKTTGMSGEKIHVAADHTKTYSSRSRVQAMIVQGPYFTETFKTIGAAIKSSVTPIW